jgi:Bacterial low temperature requirement A protein (LtrA)
LRVGEEPLWLAGAFIHDEAQLALWIIAMIIELLGVLTGFPVPRLGRSRTIDHTISGEHMAKRCRLFVLLALGAPILGRPIATAPDAGFHSQIVVPAPAGRSHRTSSDLMIARKRRPAGVDKRQEHHGRLGDGLFIGGAPSR